MAEINDEQKMQYDDLNQIIWQQQYISTIFFEHKVIRQAQKYSGKNSVIKFLSYLMNLFRNFF